MATFANLPNDIIHLILQHEGRKVDAYSEVHSLYYSRESFKLWKNMFRFMYINRAWRNVAILAIYNRLYFIQKTEKHPSSVPTSMLSEHDGEIAVTNYDLVLQSGFGNMVTKLHVYYSASSGYKWLESIYKLCDKRDSTAWISELLTKRQTSRSRARSAAHASANNMLFKAIAQILQSAFPNVTNINLYLDVAPGDAETCSLLVNAYSNQLVNLIWRVDGQLPLLKMVPKLANLDILFNQTHASSSQSINPQELKSANFLFGRKVLCWGCFSRNRDDVASFAKLKRLCFNSIRFYPDRAGSCTGRFNPDNIKLEFQSLTHLNIRGAMLTPADAKCLMQHVHNKFYFIGAPTVALELCKYRNSDARNMHFTLDTFNYNQTNFIEAANAVYKEAQGIDGLCFYIKDSAAIRNFEGLLGNFTFI